MVAGSIIWVSNNNPDSGNPNSRSCLRLDTNPESFGYRNQFGANGDYDGNPISTRVGMVGKKWIKLDSLGMGSEWMCVSCGSCTGGNTGSEFRIYSGAYAWSGFLWGGRSGV